MDKTDTNGSEQTARRATRLPGGVTMEDLCKMTGAWPKREPSDQELLETYKNHFRFRCRKEVLLVLKAMRNEFGQDACELIKQVYYRMGKEDGLALKKKHGSLLNTVADMSTRPYCYQIEHCQTSENRIEYKVVGCPSADLMKELHMEEMGDCICPSYHQGFAQAFGFKFEMPKFLLHGDNCCHQIWERVKTLSLHGKTEQ